jgi:hypothetical protein
VAIWSELLGSGTIKLPGNMGAQTEMVMPSNLTVAVFSPLWQTGPASDFAGLAVLAVLVGVTVGLVVGDASLSVATAVVLSEVGAGVRESVS